MNRPLCIPTHTKGESLWINEVAKWPSFYLSNVFNLSGRSSDYLSDKKHILIYVLILFQLTKCKKTIIIYGYFVILFDLRFSPRVHSEACVQSPGVTVVGVQLI